MIFTDKDGNKYKADTLHPMPDSSIIIKPIKEEKQKYALDFSSLNNKHFLYRGDYTFTPDQAAKVSAAMEAFMEYLLYKRSDWVEKWRHLENLMDEAKESLNND